MEYKVDNKVIEEIKKRVLNNDQGRVWLTPEISLDTKYIVRKSKKDYSSMFQDRSDENKVYWPLIKTHVDSIVGNLDYDTGDIKVTSKSADYKATAYMISELLRCQLKKKQFGRLMNEAAKYIVRDGTVVVRTNKAESFLVDIENLWTDFNTNTPTWFCERVPVPKYSLPKQWKKDKIDKSPTSKFKEVGDQVHDDTIIAYRYEGMMPRSWINGTDDESEVYGLLWITGMENGSPYVQSRKILGKDMTACSYDYAQFVPEQNRFVSIGVPEALENLQKYINLVINNRVQRANLASIGILEIRKGSGITPQDIKDMAQGGALVVNNIGSDIKSTPVQDVSPNSFNEEASIISASSTLTGSTEISRGQINRSGTTLGQANLEANFSSQRFQYHREALGFMFESILYKWTKYLIDNMNDEEIVNITSEELLREVATEQAKYDQVVAAQYAQDKFGPKVAQNILNNQGVQEKLYNDRFKKNEWKLLKKDLEDFEYEVEITVNSESKDLNAIINNIVQALPLIAQLPEGQELVTPMTDKLFESLGLSKYSLK